MLYTSQRRLLSSVIFTGIGKPCLVMLAFELMLFVNRQFYDLIEIFRIGGFAPDTNYLFLGMSVICVLQQMNCADSVWHLKVTMLTAGYSA